MGSGEPFDNYENVSTFLRIAGDPAGLGLSMRNITVSTCGIIPGIERFAEDFPQVNLAISLHAPTDEARSAIMPVNKKYPLTKLIEACRRYTEKTSRRITFEYTPCTRFKRRRRTCGASGGPSQGNTLSRQFDSSQ